MFGSGYKPEPAQDIHDYPKLFNSYFYRYQHAYEVRSTIYEVRGTIYNVQF